MNARDPQYDNDWYFWGLQNIGGVQGEMYLSFSKSTRTSQMSARDYVRWLKRVIEKSQEGITGTGYGGSPTGYAGSFRVVNDRKDAIRTMEKWLVLWDEKRAVEIPLELLDEDYDELITEGEGYHKMPDGSMMKDSEMEKKPLNSNMKFAGIAAIGLIGLMVLKK
tara:strand:- start:185 stop:679 length:495 start_codon:yes stop_codon:yes gene_type:complete